MMYYRMMYATAVMQRKLRELKENCLEKCMTSTHAGIDGILVTVGLCIIALVLCVFMKDKLGEFIKTIVGEMTDKASGMLDMTITS